jgi:amiloride-sensitive sodium channel
MLLNKFCYSYIKDNYGKHKNVSNWTIDDGFFKNNTTPNTSFPRRAITSGDSDKLSLTLQIFLKSISGMCYRSEGFKILLHHPAEVPRFITRHFRASVNQIFDIAVKPEMTVTSPNVKNYDPHVRKCYFSYERSLQFFQFYTQENCHVECLANYTLATCGCVGYYMPRKLIFLTFNIIVNKKSIVDVNSTTFCTNGDNEEYKCLRQAERM